MPTWCIAAPCRSIRSPISIRTTRRPLSRRKTTTTGRSPNPVYPPDALREAIVNALIHRDYLLTSTDIELAVYSDRLEIVSPGRLPNGITPDRMRAGTKPDTERHDARLPLSGTYGDGNSPENRQGHEGTQRHRTRSARTGRALCCTPVRVIIGVLCPATRHMVC